MTDASPLVSLRPIACLAATLVALAAAGAQGAEKAPYAFVDEFNPGWNTTQTAWRVATWKQNKTQMDPQRCAVDEKGFLVQTVLAGDPPRGGSMQTAKEYPFGRWEARLRPSSVPGVLNSMFSIDWDDLTTPDNEHDGSKFEVDIEFLTYTFGPKRGKVHFAVHVAEKKNAFVEDVELDFNPSDQFHVWGLDILPDKIVWHVDGRILRQWARPEKYTWKDNYEFFFNSWTSKKWIKGPPAKTAVYKIDWVRFTPQKDIPRLPALKPAAKPATRAARRKGMTVATCVACGHTQEMTKAEAARKFMAIPEDKRRAMHPMRVMCEKCRDKRYTAVVGLVCPKCKKGFVSPKALFQVKSQLGLPIDTDEKPGEKIICPHCGVDVRDWWRKNKGRPKK